MASATKSIPFVVSPQVSPQIQIVPQDKLALIISLRHEIEQLEAQLGEAHTEVKAALESGAEVEPGLFRASLKVTERTNVSWKSVVERELGGDYAKRVLAATKPDKYTHLVVTA
jgi:hypothetical protein